VWRAVDEAAGHDVAVKALGTQPDWSTADRARLRLAFRTTAAVSGPGIAQVHEYGDLDLGGGLAVPYLVRELVTGQSLEERLSGGPAPVDEALGVVARVADALAAAHRAGVVHGNLVPANVILGPAGVTVTDFGLWALRDHLAGAHRPAGPRQSVLSYAAPERLSGEPASPAADMYSLGVLFVACLSGIAAGGTAGAAPVMDPDDSVAPSLASLWAACLGANPRERPSAAHAAFMSREILAVYPRPSAQESDSTPVPGEVADGVPVQAQARRPGTRRRRGLVALGIVAGITAAVAMLTQFLASPSAQTTGASATPSVHVPAGLRPSADVSSSVLASAAPPPLQVLDQIRATLRRGVAAGQIRQDVAVDLDNLLQPIQADLAAGHTAPVPQLVAGLRAKLDTRLLEGAITEPAGKQLGSELATLLRSISGR
jgi:eukaryotic-like serine/threonine-protein kinase